jgi:hypothetical protein
MNLARFDAEIVLSFADKRALLFDPLYLVEQPLICLDCGFVECKVPIAELLSLRTQATS